MARFGWQLWFATCGIGAFLLLGAMFRALDGSAFMLCIGCNETLDQAQEKFEKAQKGYDFVAWRKTGDLKCQNSPTLRICQAMPVMARSHTGEDVYVARDFMSFACSTTECAWVDP
jgi:hypothetical protein